MSADFEPDRNKQNNQETESSDLAGLYISGQSAAENFFAGCVEDVFITKLGVADVEIVDYVSDLLAKKFLRSDYLDIYNRSNETISGLWSLIEKTTTSSMDAVSRVQCYQKIGDISLFFCGYLPEAIDKIKRIAGADYLMDYSAQGKRAFYMASQLSEDIEEPELNNPDLLKRISNQFDMLAYGLGEVKKEFSL